jgi:hypothetical protein
MATWLSCGATLKLCVDEAKVQLWPNFPALSTRHLFEAMKIGAGTRCRPVKSDFESPSQRHPNNRFGRQRAGQDRRAKVR